MADEKQGKAGIRVDFYDGAYGPTIRIDANTLEDLNRIKSVFLNLAEQGHEINLLDLIGASVSGVDRLTLKRVEVSEEQTKSLKRKGSRLGIEFVWSLSAKGWQRRAGLVDGLINFNRPSHQYLTEEGVDDAIIELAFRESPCC
jgi:hypothetical protein